MLSALKQNILQLTATQYIVYNIFPHIMCSDPRVGATNTAFAESLALEWARPDLNWRSSPCQGDVITPRPRALWNLGE